MYTLYEQNAEVRTPTRVGSASEQALRDALENFDRDAGAWFLAQHVSTSRLLFQLGGACGAASGPNCRGSCGTCDDAAVRSRVDNHVNGDASNLAVDGEGDRGGACAPTLRVVNDPDPKVTTWFVNASDGRPISKPVVRFTDVAGGTFVVPAANVTAADGAAGTTFRPAIPPNPCDGVANADGRVGDGVCDADLNVAPCFDGGDCCEDTCGLDAARLEASASCGTNSYACLDRGVDAVTGLPGAGAWAAYNDAVAAATALASSWRVDVALTSATATGLADGALRGEVCCSRDDAGDDPFGNEFGWVRRHERGNRVGLPRSHARFNARARVAGDVHHRERCVHDRAERRGDPRFSRERRAERRAQLHNRRRRVDARLGDARRQRGGRRRRPLGGQLHLALRAHSRLDRAGPRHRVPDRFGGASNGPGRDSFGGGREPVSGGRARALGGGFHGRRRV
jgi:hypothetical protein